MTSQAIKNIKDSFEANQAATTLYANEHGHCFTAGGENLTPISREEAEALNETADEVTEGAPKKKKK